MLKYLTYILCIHKNIFYTYLHIYMYICTVSEEKTEQAGYVKLLCKLIFLGGRERGEGRNSISSKFITLLSKAYYVHQLIPYHEKQSVKRVL